MPGDTLHSNTLGNLARKNAKLGSNKPNTKFALMTNTSLGN